MKNIKYNLIVGLLVIIVVIVAGLAGIYFGGGFKPKVIANGIVLNKNDDYVSTFIKTYDEYVNLLDKYNITNVVLLTNNDFNDYDYLVDFINYKDDLDIKNIDIFIEDDGITLTYTVNKRIDDSKKMLMYFIPVNKDSLEITNIKSREFVEK